MKKCLSILVVLLLIGCAPVLNHSTIKELSQTVKYSDGVDRVEAILLAQDFIIKKSLYDRLVSIDPYRAEKRTLWFRHGQPRVYAVLPKNQKDVDRKRTWTLLFKDRRHTLFYFFPIAPFHVIVDADSGEILNWGMKTLEFDKKTHTTIEIYE